VVSRCELDHLAHIAHIGGIELQARCGRAPVKSITREDGRLKANRELRGNSLPHLPINDVVKIRQKTAKLLVHASSNGNCWTLNQLLSRDLSVPVVQQTGGFPVQLGYTNPMSIRIHDRVSTKDRASLAALHPFTQKIIEARQHNVILVKSADLSARAPRERAAFQS
jgi:hypothetical protein